MHACTQACLNQNPNPDISHRAYAYNHKTKPPRPLVASKEPFFPIPSLAICSYSKINATSHHTIARQYPSEIPEMWPMIIVILLVVPPLLSLPYLLLLNFDLHYHRLHRLLLLLSC